MWPQGNKKLLRQCYHYSLYILKDVKIRCSISFLNILYQIFCFHLRWRIDNKPLLEFYQSLCFYEEDNTLSLYFVKCVQKLSPDGFCKKGVLPTTATLLKERLWHMCFPVNIAKYLRTLFFIQHLWWLVLYVIILYVSWIGGFQVRLI